MNKEELRIGNLVYDTKGGINTVCVETFVKFSPQIKPIELNENWLEKFGLIKKYLENQFEEGGFDLNKDGSRWYYWVDKGVFNLEIQTNGEIWFEIYSCYKQIKYIHELQNLYFSLTGTELQTGGI